MRSSLVAALVGGMTLTAGCDAAVQQYGCPLHGCDSVAQVHCRIIDISTIRADRTNRVAPTDLSRAERRAGLKPGRDARSFVARVGAADLADAGMDVGLLPRDHDLLLFVNHGWWNGPQGVSIGLDSEPGATERMSPDKTGVAWELVVLDPRGHRSIQRLTSPDNGCFKG